MTYKTPIYELTLKTINQLENTRDYPPTKRFLAELKREGNIPSKIFELIPPDKCNYDEKLNNFEKSFILTLKLYAIFSQGRKDVNTNDYKNFGESLRSLKSENNPSTDKRFDALITSCDFDEFSNHLRHMITLLKSKNNAKINFALLSQDIYKVANNNYEPLRIKWAKGYYVNPRKEDKNDK